MLLEINPLVLPDPGILIWATVSFLVLIFLLKKFAWKPILKAIDEREQTITDSIASAEKIKAEMAQLKSDNETLLIKAREERAELLKDAKLTKDKMIADAKNEAKVQGAKMIEEAQAAIEYQKLAAVNELKNQVGKLVIEVSEKILRRELSNKAEQETYIKKLAEEAKLN
jgi:F-type H+-transporting ATPase subunit b